MEEIDKDAKPQQIKILGLKDYFPYISAFIIFLGIVRLITFYASFGVPILQFLDFTEIITSFLDILVLAVILVVAIIINSFLTDDNEITNKKSLQREEIFKEDDYGKRLLLYLRYVREIIFIGLLTILGFVIYHFIDNTFPLQINVLVSFYYCAFLLYVIAILTIERKHRQTSSNRLRRQNFSVFFNFIILTLIVVAIASYQANAIKRHHSTAGTIIKLDNNEIIVCDSLSYFVGNTKNFLFIYHAAESRSDVFPMSRIKEITLPKHTFHHPLFDNLY